MIVRDNGCDLGIEGHEIYGKILIHHMNPISVEDILRRSDFLLNPEYLISTILTTHNAIHYGDESLLVTEPIVRSRNDTCPGNVDGEEVIEIMESVLTSIKKCLVLQKSMNISIQILSCISIRCL